jgi:hypothetical protein
MEATALQWLNLAINAVGVAALVIGSVRVGRILETLEAHTRELEENREEHGEIWKRLWEFRR